MKKGGFAGLSAIPHGSPHLWTNRVHSSHFVVLPVPFPVDNSVYEGSSILAPRPAPLWGIFFSLRPREADLPAQRAQAEASARLPCANVHARGPGDSEAAAREGPEAAVRLIQVHRRHRLSRSRDFDAVYRQGRSASTRFLVLYWFEREGEEGEPRLGLAVPRAAGNAVARNRIKRQLREVWRERLGRIPVGRDYVLIA
jgi:ribonuclease P protein component